MSVCVVNDEFKDMSDARKSRGFLGMVRLTQLPASTVQCLDTNSLYMIVGCVQLALMMGKFFVRGAQAADKALVNANALESVDVEEEAEPMTPGQVLELPLTPCVSWYIPLPSDVNLV